MNANGSLALVLLLACALTSSPIAAGQPGPRPLPKPGPKPLPKPGPNPLPKPGPNPLPKPAPKPTPVPVPAVSAKAAALAAINARLTAPLAATLLRLAFHDAGTFVKVNNTGGANGSLQYEINAPVSAGLAGGFNHLQNVQAQLVSLGVVVSWADLFQLGGAAAVALTGGPVIDVAMGRKDVAIGVQDPNLSTVLPAANQRAPALKSLFAAKGFTTHDLVVLSGAHSIGVSHATNPRGPMTQQPNVFGSHYFTELLNGGGAFPSDKTLLSDPTTLQWVQLYAGNQAQFFTDFTATYLKMGLIGASI